VEHEAMVGTGKSMFGKSLLLGLVVAAWPAAGATSAAVTSGRETGTVVLLMTGLAIVALRFSRQAGTFPGRKESMKELRAARRVMNRRRADAAESL
jgi:hypothetical protein